MHDEWLSEPGSVIVTVIGIGSVMGGGDTGCVHCMEVLWISL